MTWTLFVFGALWVEGAETFKTTCLGLGVMCLATALHVHAFGWQP